MFWINPEYRALLADATLESYEAAAELRPTDDYVEKQGRSTGRYRLKVGTHCRISLSRSLSVPETLAPTFTTLRPVRRPPEVERIGTFRSIGALQRLGVAFGAPVAMIAL